MAASRKNRTASPRSKVGIGAARAASQAKSLPDDNAVTEPVVPVLADAEVVVEAVVTEAIASEEIGSEEIGSEPVTTEPVPESVIEIVTDFEPAFEPALLVDELNPIVEASAPEEILEAEIEVSDLLESSPENSEVQEVMLESVPQDVLQSDVAPVPEANTPILEEIPAKVAAASPSRSKSKVSNPKSSVQRPKGDKTMTQETEKSAPLATKKESAIAKTGSALPVRPVMPSELTVVGTISSAGERPIGAATMAVFGTYLNGRPIEASSLKLFEILPGDRPIFATDVAYIPDAAFGGRPIMVSPAGLLGAEEVMGNRPIFRNDIVDPDSASLMGYLD